MALALEGALCDNRVNLLQHYLPQLALLATTCTFPGQSDVQPLLSYQGYACPSLGRAAG